MKESSIIKYFMNAGLISADEEEVKTCYNNYIEEDKIKLEKLLNREQIQIFTRLLSNLTSHMFIIRDEECSKMFHLGIQLGMEIKEFDYEEEK